MDITSQFIKSKAAELGFAACGIAKAEKVDAGEERRVRERWEKGLDADMEWLGRNIEKRINPQLLMPGVKSIVCVTMNYAPAKTIPDSQPQIASYALGKDYHDVLKKKLHQLAGAIFGTPSSSFCPVGSSGRSNNSSSFQSSETIPAYRAFVDTAPVLERYWAEKAGLGWRGKNQNLIIPGAGSYYFLGELFLDIELEYDPPMPNRCGRCRRCLDACPTGALRLRKTDNTQSVSSQANVGAAATELDASLCLSYQTIENRGELSELAKQKIGDYIYGCDRCQKACPWNRMAKPNNTPEFQPSDELLDMTWEKWEHLSEDDYRRLFKGSAVKRAKYSGLTRNIAAALKAKKETSAL